jgi:serine/threonine protein phosphatase PrpC
MGAYLDTPNTEKNSENGQNDMAAWGLCSMQGWRTGMEDDHIAQECTQANGKMGMLFAVFDGHGGAEVAKFAKEKFGDMFINCPEFKKANYEEALKQTFLNFDELVGKKDYGMDTGTTANVVYFNDEKIFCSNAGDSRSVIYTNNKAIPLSQDHKPDNEEERERIERANHFVEESRVDGNLALSRAFGDFQYKDQKGKQPKDQAVSCFPDVSSTNRTKQN